MGPNLIRCFCLVTKLCLTLLGPHGPPAGSSVCGISQARILEWVAISFSRGSSPPRDQIWVSYLVDGFFTTEPPEVQSNMTGVLVRGEETQTHRKQHHVKTEAETTWCVYKPGMSRAASRTRNWEKGRHGPDPPPETSESVWPCQYFIFRRLASRTMKESISVVWTHQVVVI